jgi:hypothetical protein
MTNSLTCIRPNAVGFDIRSRFYFVAAPSDRDCKVVREFGFFTEDLYELVKWLKNVSGRKTDVLDCQWIQQLHCKR